MVGAVHGPLRVLTTALRTVHDDATFVVVDKPAGLLAVPGVGPANADSAATRLRAQDPNIRVVHRLDQATSGLIVFARSLAAQRALSGAFEARTVHKQYVAVVEGLVAEDTGEISLPLRADWPNRPRQVVDAESGKPALTRWRVLHRDALHGRTRLLLMPVTGRSHQLRVHLMALGHAILGDTLYAADSTLAPRLLLHASRLEFDHPGTGIRCSFASEVPF